jgi:octaprenyl-diphosphate synthase
MPDIHDIRRPVEEQMALFERYLQDMLSVCPPQLAPMAGYIASSRGKSIRPLLVMLSAGLFPGAAQNGERALVGAMLVEMLHKASLVHDDVVDSSYLRRGAPSVNALWGDHRAVLAGDYVIARAFSQGLHSGHHDLVSEICDSLGRVCEGEMLQSWQSDRLEMTRELYLDIIYKKTALVLGSSGATGAMAARATEHDVAAMRSFGDHLGTAFQIRDDVLDYAPASQTGKPACGDLRERKINMPLLAVLEHAAPARRRELLQKLSDVRRSPANVDHLAAAVVDEGGLEKAAALMEEYLSRARAILDAWPASPCRASLAMLCDYVATREK